MREMISLCNSELAHSPHFSYFETRENEIGGAFCITKISALKVLRQASNWVWNGSHSTFSYPVGTVNVLDKQSWTADKVWSSSFGVGREANNSYLVTKRNTEPRNWTSARPL